MSYTLPWPSTSLNFQGCITLKESSSTKDSLRGGAILTAIKTLSKLQQRKAVCLSGNAALKQATQLVPPSTPLPYRHSGPSVYLFHPNCLSLMNSAVQSRPHAVLSFLNAACSCITSSPQNGCTQRAKDLLSPLLSLTQSPVW